MIFIKLEHAQARGSLYLNVDHVTGISEGYNPSSAKIHAAGSEFQVKGTQDQVLDLVNKAQDIRHRARMGQDSEPKQDEQSGTSHD